MAQHEFTATLYTFEDGTLALLNSDITGLVLETSSFKEMQSELYRLAPRLLRSNHGLVEDEIAQAYLRIEVRPATELEGSARSPAQAPMIWWKDTENIRDLMYA